MKETKIKKKKLTLSVSSKKSHSAPYYAQSRGKTSVVIEKKPQRRWGEKKFQSRDNNFNKPKSSDSSISKKTSINRNVDLRKIAEERATKRFKNLNEPSLQQKKSGLGKEKGGKSFGGKGFGGKGFGKDGKGSNGKGKGQGPLDGSGCWTCGGARFAWQCPQAPQQQQKGQIRHL